jgi:hypothetical protein
VDAVAQAIDQLKAKFNPVRTVLAGHSGGAAILGNLLGGPFHRGCGIDGRVSLRPSGMA